MTRQLTMLLLIVLLLSSVNHTAYADPTRTLPRLPICGDQDGSEIPLIFRCSSFYLARDVQAYQVPGVGPITLQFDFAYREAIYNNELVYYLVDTPLGTIDSLSPGDPGYLSAVLSRAQVVFPSGSTASSPDKSLIFNGGDIIVFFIIRNDTLSNIILNNPENSPNKLPLAFFSIDDLSPDGVDHLVGYQSIGNKKFTQFGFEDVIGGGDLDYDDIVYNITPPLVPINGQSIGLPLIVRPE
jgi:Domain of unknown function (DUF4114)